MTSLGSLLKPTPRPLDIPSLADHLAYLTAAGTTSGTLGSGPAILASLAAWVAQDEDAHEPCSLTACRHPLHPGPCKGWKGTLHSVSPGTYKQIEEARVQKANERRVKRIADLRSQGKPIPRRLLTEIKPKPAPTHPAHQAQPVPLGQVNQKADLAGGQAHHAGQAVSKAAGVTVKTAPLPLGPKKQKPTVAGRGPAFVITQPKVTDQYKLDKAAKITPQEWAGLSDADKTTIRNELVAIKARGFGPQQKKSDELLAKFPAPSAAQKATPGTNPGAAHQVPSAPGKVSLGQAIKTVPSAPAHTPTPQLPAPAPSPKLGTRDQNGILNKPLPGGSVSSTSVGLPNGYRITRDGMGYSLKHNGKLIRTSATQAALEKYAHDHAKGASGTPSVPAPAAPASSPTPSLPDQIKADQVKAKTGTTHIVTPLGAEGLIKQHGSADITFAKGTAYEKTYTDVGLQGRGDHQHYLVNKGAGDRYIVDKGGKDLQHLPKQSGITVVVGPAKAAAPAPSAPSGPTPQAPGPPNNTPNAFPPHVQHARAVAGRALGGRPTAKTHVDTYGKLSKADFDSLDAPTQKTIRDDLANAKAKFLDPKKQQAAKDLLDRFGSRHPVAPSAAPAHPKGYSDPQQEVVKAATSGMIDTDKILQTVARLSPDSVSKLDDGDRKAVLGRLAFIATHPKATDEQKAKATAYGRIVNGNTRVPDSVKFDHTPSIGELHTEEQKGGHAAAFDALIAAQDKTLDRAARLKALSALTKPQFDALKPDEQRLITDALHGLHVDQQTPSGITAQDPVAEKALITYTGVHPGLHQLQQAEADFRAGKIDADKLWSEFLHARVAAPSKMNDPTSPGAVLAKEAQRVAEDNPSLPVWLRASMIDNPYGGGTYYSISKAQNRYNYADAPRLSQSDISDIFRATEAELAASHPVHAEAVKALRIHVLETGLAPGSPWSTATRNHVVDNLLHISGGHPEIPPERLKEFQGLPAVVQVRVRRVVRDRITNQTNVHAKTGTYIALRELEGDGKAAPNTHAALMAAEDSFANPSKLDVFRALEPADYNALPGYVQEAIKSHLEKLQTNAERSGPIHTWSQGDNPFKVMPAALLAHLERTRSVYADRHDRQAVDLASYGQGIINPYDRTRAYGEVPIGRFQGLAPGDQKKITDDLDGISHNPATPLPVRYNAQVTKEMRLGNPTFNASQFTAVGNVDPTHPSSDNTVQAALGVLSKSDYDALDKTFRDAIDARVATLPGMVQQSLDAKFHPAAPSATPSGYTPTTVQANVPPHVQAALDTIYGTHASGKSHTMAHQLSTYGALRGSDFSQLNAQEQGHLLGDLSFIATTAKAPSADKARKLIDRFTPPGTPSGQVPTGAVIPPANAVPGQVRYATPLKGLEQAKDSGTSGDGWISLPGGGRVWGAHGAAGLLLQHVDPQTGEKRYLMVQRGPAISDPGKWTFPGGASDSKETPHQGAARETIEELGLKPDALKDALVHGDHTFSVPNHTWKYTTVAAQVPTMIKPNLTTAHARAETSDAKWMTIDEIRALDKSGQLHGPIAGGKLEQNVISLYPAAGTGKLGQVARPGPVTKRLGRLNLPSGGRQAPTTFNAWPHPHKQSKGRNLVSDKTNIDKLRQDVKQARRQYDGKTADGRLAAIGNMQGFDDTPTVASKKEVDRLLATGDYIEVWRGVKGGNYRAGGKTAAQINEEMRSGPAYYGKGIFGNGYYLATQKSVATQYADNTKNSIARILIPKSAITEHYDKVEREAHAASSRSSKAKGNTYEEGTLYDPGRWAAAKGIDGIEIQPHHTSGGGWARHIAKPGQPAFNWLNRSVLIIQEAQ